METRDRAPKDATRVLMIERSYLRLHIQKSRATNRSQTGTVLRFLRALRGFATSPWCACSADDATNN
jgi:hypothetical protein